VREDDELSETRPHVVVSPERERKQCSRLWDSDDGDEDDGDKDEDGVTTLDTDYCSSLRDFYYEKEKRI
jgi:hypothetical protein